ncbi:unnamed protein product [Calicophoron daubneyi]|uniref:Uncharacterized protein n=1 Tax=Calicophoron daubneyi TaxID=300641 RepID=A0AAV2TBX4_CALDB
MENLEQKKNALRIQVNSIEKGLEPPLQNKFQVQQKALKGLIRQMAKSRRENMLKLDRMHRENLALQIDLSAYLENRGHSDRESAEDNEEEYKECQLNVGQDEERGLWRTLEAVESTATIFTSHRPALLEKGKVIEEDLQPVSHTPTDEESKVNTMRSNTFIYFSDHGFRLFSARFHFAHMLSVVAFSQPLK